MVGQKALFTTIRLYGLQSLLLAIVATTMAISESRQSCSSRPRSPSCSKPF